MTDTRINTVSYLSGEAEIWLDTDAATCDGVCLGVAPTYAQALQQAREELEAALEHVKAMQAAAGVPPEVTP